MLSVTGTLAAAITSAVRRPTVRVVADWLGAAVSTYDDLTSAVSAVTLNKTLTSDLPPEANLIAGSTATAAGVDLDGEIAGSPAGWLLNPYKGVLPGSQRMGSPVTVELGFVTDAGPEYVTQFTGKVRDAGIGSAATASLSALDGPEILTKPVDVPAIAAGDPAGGARFQGAELGFLVDYVLRRQGWYRSLPPQPGTYLCATLHGSVWPEVGIGGASRATLIDDTTSPSTYAKPSFTDTPRGRGLAFAVAPWLRSSGLTQMSAPIFATAGATVFLEVEEFRLDSAPTTGTPYVEMVTLRGLTTSPTDWLILAYNPSTTMVRVRFARGSGTLDLDVGTIAWPYGSTVYLGLHVTYTASGASVNVRIGSTTLSASTSSISHLTGPGLEVVEYATAYGPGGHIAGIHITPGVAYSAGIWRNAVTPAPAPALDKSLTSLVATVPRESAEPWPLLQEIAAAEGGMLFINEAGVPTFWNRDHFTAGTAVKTISADLGLKTLSAAEAVDTVRNVVKVTAAPPEVDRADSVIWSSTEIVTVPAGGSVEVPMQFEGAALIIDTAMTYYSGSTGVASGSGYRAAKSADGATGDVSNLGFTWDLHPSRATLTITNPNGFAVWLVENGLASTTRGQPMLQIVGRLARPTQNPYTVVARDDDSVALYDERVLDVPASDWRQNADAARDLADYLLTQLREPHVAVTSLDAVGDPRVQVGDAVTVIDTGVIGIVRDFRVMGLTRRLDASGLSDTYQVREIGPATTGMTGILTLDDPLLGVLDRLNGAG